MRAFAAQQRNRWQWGRASIAAVVLLCALWGLALTGRDAKGATSDGCSPGPCVILIQVDGLEPKDVTQATTPYLWLLAHPRPQGQPIPGGALNQRSGFIWQAPRGVVSTGTASATASLLTGGFPEKTGVPADNFYALDQSKKPTAPQRLTAGGFGDLASSEAGADAAQPIASLPIDTVIQQVDRSAVFVGDPGLAEMTDAATKGTPHWFPPGDENSATTVEQQYTGDPRLCPIPRYPDGGAQIPGQSPAQDNYDPRRCPANDFTTMNKAFGDLTGQKGTDVGFTFIHLAELGAAKRLTADHVDGNSAADPASTPPQPPQALSDMDQAVATFVEHYAQTLPSKWGKTVLMVVGSHGYQTTPVAARVPDPDNVTDPTQDLSDYVGRYSKGGVVPGSLRLVPQGTTATIYYQTAVDPEGRTNALDAIKNELENGAVNPACAQRDQAALGPCIRKVYYVDKSTPGAEDTIAAKHPTWHLDALSLDNGVRTGVSGDLVVEFGRGWASGRAVGTPYQAGVTGRPLTNPNTSSSGGPQERAVAALINGPSPEGSLGAVRNLDSLASSQLGLTQLKYYPVSKTAVDPSDPNNPPPVTDPACPDTTTDPGGLACANKPSEVGDDPSAIGHEAQPQTVDFAVTISALMQLPFDSHPDQLQGRTLQEAFLKPLTRPCVGDACEPPPPPEPQPEPPPPPPPPPPVVVQQEGFNFHGLVRDLKALVVDSRDLPFAKAKRGADLSTIRLEGDFGKPKSAVTLTFYRATAARARAGASRLRLKAIVHFDPFPVVRGHVKIRLKVPAVFSPTYIGMTVREIATGPRAQTSQTVPCTTVKTFKPVTLKCTGPAAGVIVPIGDAGRLHSRKSATGGGRRPR